MSNPNQAKIDDLNARIRGLRASMADMGYSMRQGVREQIKATEEHIAMLEKG